MTTSGKKRLFPLAAFIALLIAVLIIPWAAQAGSAFPPNPDTYWNAGMRPLPSNGQGDIQHCTLESSHLNTPNNVVGFNVYTPPSYDSSSQSYPVIYVLHGLNGNEYNYINGFSTNSFFSSSSGSLAGLIDSGLADEAILVFVNGGARSFYDDWDNTTGNGPNSSFPILSETVIMQDVIPFVDANFRTIPNRNGRAIEGFSMGGRGAIKFAFTYPDQFCSTIAYAAAGFEAIPTSAGLDHPRLGPLPEAYQMSTITANNATAIKTNDLRIRLVDGAGDGAAGQGGGSVDLSPQLTSLGIAHEFVPSLNGVTSHDWAQYHQETGAYGLNFHFACFSAANSVLPAHTILGSSDLFTYLPLVVNPTNITTPPVQGTCN